MAEQTRDPQTSDEWQQAVDAAHALLLIHSARSYGLIEGAPKINTARCEAILKLGRDRGHHPADDALERMVAEINRNAPDPRGRRA